jgi:hypothetical protein
VLAKCARQSQCPCGAHAPLLPHVRHTAASPQVQRPLVASKLRLPPPTLTAYHVRQLWKSKACLLYAAEASVVATSSVKLGGWP